MKKCLCRMICIGFVLHEPINILYRQVERGRGNFLGEDNSCDSILAIYTKLFIDGVHLHTVYVQTIMSNVGFILQKAETYSLPVCAYLR